MAKVEMPLTVCITIRHNKVVSSKVSPKSTKGKKVALKGSTTYRVPVCSEKKHKPTVRLNVGKPPKMRRLEVNEGHSSLDDFQLTSATPAKRPKEPVATTSVASQGSSYDCNKSDIGGGGAEEDWSKVGTIM